MSTNALSGHGALIYRQPNATPGVFTVISEMNDVTLPEFSRNEFDITTQNEDIDSYQLGVLRRSPVTVGINFIPSDGTHDHLTGLIKAIKDNLYDGYKFTTPGGLILIASGQVQKVGPIKAPVDGPLKADVTIRLSGKFSINGVIFG